MATRKKLNCNEDREDQWALPDPESDNVGVGTVAVVHRAKMRLPGVTERSWGWLLPAIVWSSGTGKWD